ncbi:DCC1-like thiol-disulfide oxidoreductase family protein [Breoghania sp.]|uniref:DCC1-like thiol-disulfide oxidoreductase family protein n=1 Tax=Breoghania sp. TaxID=2065378 RepID=UPI002AAADBAF|nr:DCC1-like thiol-disulfide oxidoreductase family protein [Breoghania sp.]
MGGIQILYDGQCPFCSAYVTMTRLRAAVGEVELIDARCDHPLVREALAAGYDLDKGMLARYRGRDHFGADCVQLLSTLSSREGLANRMMSIMLGRRAMARCLYPVLRFGRNMTLRVLGRRPIGGRKPTG